MGWSLSAFRSKSFLRVNKCIELKKGLKKRIYNLSLDW